MAIRPVIAVLPSSARASAPSRWKPAVPTDCRTCLHSALPRSIFSQQPLSDCVPFSSIRAERALVQLRRQLEVETSAAMGRFIVGSNVSTMRFDDGARNPQAQSHAGVLGREKAVKEVIEMLRLDAGTAVVESAA